jgi:hypothetical protein
MDPFPNYNDPHANDLYNPSSAYGLPGSNDYQFDFDISQTADVFPGNNNINGLNHALEAEQLFRQNFQTGQNFNQTSQAFQTSQNFNQTSPSFQTSQAIQTGQAFQTSQNFNQTAPNFQTNMPLYANPLALVNSRSGGHGQGDTALNHQLVDESEHQHRPQRRRIESRSSVSGHGSDLFQMGHGFGQPINGLPVRSRRAPLFFVCFPQSQ